MSDLTLVTLDLATLPTQAQAIPPSRDEEWQKPIIAHKLRNQPLPRQTPPPTPPSPAAGNGTATIQTVAQVSQLPHFITQLKAVYPESAKHSNVEGVVVLQVDIDATGGIMDVEVVQSLGFGCDEAAVAALKGSTFSPAYEDGMPVPVRIRIPYRFKFSD